MRASRAALSGLVKTTWAGARSDVAVVTLNAPDSLNALTEAMGNEFHDAVTDSALRGRARALVLTGAGRAFSAGGDLRWLRARHDAAPDSNVETMRAFYAKYLSVLSGPVPIPTIAAVNGPAVGAGLCLAMACDMRVAARGAKLGVTFGKLNLHAGMGGSLTMPHLIGSEAALRLMLSSELVSAEEAHRIKLVGEVAEDASERAVALADELTGACGPMATATMVETVRSQKWAGEEEALQREAEVQAACYQTTDFKNALEQAISGVRTAPEWLGE